MRARRLLAALGLLSMWGGWCACRTHMAVGVRDTPAYEPVHVELKADRPFMLGPGTVLLTAFVRGDIPQKFTKRWLCPEQVWDFGDATGSTQWEAPCDDAEPGRVYSTRHIFKTAGIFKVRLRLNAMDGGFAMADGQVVVTVGAPE